MSKTLIDINGSALTYVDTDMTAGKAIITVEQECQDVIDQCTVERNMDKLRGHRKTPWGKKVASIPTKVIEILKAQGMDIMGDPEAMRKFLNDPAWAVFRTSNGKV